MKKIILFVLLATLLSGCDEVAESFNYVVVTVTGTAHIWINEFVENKEVSKDLSDEPIEMSLIKAGGERVDDIGVSGSSGLTTLTAIFNVYKEQPVEFKAKSVNHPSHLGSDKVSWDYIDKNAKTPDNNKTGPRILKVGLIVNMQLSAGEVEDN